MPRQIKKGVKTLKDLQPIIKVQQSKIEAETKQILQQEAKIIFDYFPHIEAIRWTQRLPLENTEFAPVHKSEFVLDGFEYNVRRSGIQARSMFDEDWISPWNESRVEQSDLLDQFTDFEQRLFDAELELKAAIGFYDRVTVTRKDVILDNY